MVQVFATGWPDQDFLNRAAEQAAWKRRPDLVRLLLEHGADMKTVPLESVAEYCDRYLLRLFLESWEEVGTRHGVIDILLGKRIRS